MQYGFIKSILLVIIITFAFSNSSAQSFASSDKKKKEMISSVGAGVSGAEMKGFNIMGGNISFAERKPFAFIGKNASISLDIMVSLTLGPATEKKKESFGILPTGIVSINFNTHALSSKANKSRFGGFFGIGLLVVNTKTVETKDFNGNVTRSSSGMLGPAVIFGPSFKLGKSYMDVRFYGGITMGGVASGMSYGGMTMMYAFGMKKKKVGGMW